MIKLVLPVLICLSVNCASTITVCDEAARIRAEARKMIGEQRAMLESKALGLEEACSKEMNINYQQMQRLIPRK